MQTVKHLAMSAAVVVAVLFALGQFPTVRTKVLGI
jgi:hypothetical protein